MREAATDCMKAVGLLGVLSSAFVTGVAIEVALAVGERTEKFIERVTPKIKGIIAGIGDA